MHIPDGFINAGTSLGAGVAAAGGIGYSMRRAAKQLSDKHAPLAGLVAAYVFALQMLNFPVAAGTSGHLLGGVLAAVLVGPWAGAICIAVVLVVQALLFADGGLSALGLNVLNMSFVGGIGGYTLFVALRKLIPTNKTTITVIAGVAAGLSVPLAAIAFVAEYAIGGSGGAPIDKVLLAMGGVHLLIGIGEGIITALTIGAVIGVRPDLVYGAAPLLSSQIEPQSVNA